MAKTKEQKKEIVKQFTSELEKAKSLVFVDYYGLNVGDINDFRNVLKQGGCKYMVAKKTLLKRSFDNAGFKGIDLDAMDGGLGVIFGYDDEMAPAKIVFQFIKKHKQMKIQGGIFNVEFIDANTVKTLASLPSEQELLAQVIGVMMAPISNFVSVLNGNIRGLVQILSAIKK